VAAEELAANRDEQVEVDQVVLGAQTLLVVLERVVKEMTAALAREARVAAAAALGELATQETYQTEQAEQV